MRVVLVMSGWGDRSSRFLPPHPTHHMRLVDRRSFALILSLVPFALCATLWPRFLLLLSVVGREKKTRVCVSRPREIKETGVFGVCLPIGGEDISDFVVVDKQVLSAQRPTHHTYYTRREKSGTFIAWPSLFRGGHSFCVTPHSGVAAAFVCSTWKRSWQVPDAGHHTKTNPRWSPCNIEACRCSHGIMAT